MSSSVAPMISHNSLEHSILLFFIATARRTVQGGWGVMILERRASFHGMIIKYYRVGWDQRGDRLLLLRWMEMMIIIILLRVSLSTGVTLQ